MTTRIDVVPLPIPRRFNTRWVRLALAFLTCAVVADSLIGERGFAARARAADEYSKATRALRAMQNENAGLREQIRRLQSDPTTIEAVAREELGLIRPGEILFVMTPVMRP